MAAKPRVLVIGGGFAGVTVAKSLKGVADVTIVDRKDFFDMNIANVRAVVDPETAKRNTFLYKDCKNLGRFIQGSIVALAANSAQLDGGQSIAFDYAVISVGSSYVASWAKAQVLTREDRLAELRTEAQRIRDAKNVVVVGGGPVAVETAAEILEAYAGKKVTIVTPGSTLLEEKPKIAGKALKWLHGKGATVLFNDRVEEFPGSLPGVVVTKTGKELPADYVLKCYGTRHNTDFIRAGGLAGILDAKGAVKVDANLQVVGHPNMWALGDCNSVVETKLAYYAGLQAQLTAKNIAAVLKGKGQKAWVPYNGTPAMFVTLGRGTGTGMMGGCVCPGFMVASVKSKDLFVTKMRDDLMN